jgi:hypothetical protein
MALLDPITHFRPPLTHTNHHRPALRGRPQPFQSLSDPHPQPFQAFLYVRLSRSGVSLLGASLLSADVAGTVARPEVSIQRVFISRGRTRAHWKALVKAHTIVQ